MAKYSIEGLDCAHCANDIECELRKAEGLGDARLNFAAAALYIDESHESRAREIIGRIEPGVTIRAENKSERGSGTAEGPRDLLPLRIGVAATLMVAGIIFGDALRATPFGLAEYAVFLFAYAFVGGPVLAASLGGLVRGRVFDERFLMSVATLGAIAIHQLPEAVGVMLFYELGEFLEGRAVARSRKSIAALMDLRPDFARLYVDGKSRVVEPERISSGDIVEVLPGERVPLDGTVIEGESFVDGSAMTGESVPRRVGPGSAVLGGFVNDEGRLLVRVDREFDEGTAARILDLVENAASRKAPAERFMTRFAAVYTPIVVVVAIIVAALPPLLAPGTSVAASLYRALVVLVVSCPCALVLSIPLGYFGGLGGASRNGLLVKGANVLDRLVKVDTVVFDKTGTLTEGRFALRRVVPGEGFGEGELLSWAAAAESGSSHPIARAIREASPDVSPVVREVVERKGHGVLAKVDGHTVIVGNERLLRREGVEFESSPGEDSRVYVALDGRYAGRLVISDSIKAEAKETLRELRNLGVRRIVMLSGDARGAAEGVAAELGLDGFHAELLPDEKVAKLEEIGADPDLDGAVVFVGDGMNDAPVLMRADVGFAMGGLGSDAAVEAADVVVMDDGLSRIPAAIRIARFTRRIVYENIVFAIGVKAAIIALGGMGLANMWEAVIGDVGVALLAILNSLRTARRGSRGFGVRRASSSAHRREERKDIAVA